jgi:hypothetical protein
MRGAHGFLDRLGAEVAASELYNVIGYGWKDISGNDRLSLRYGDGKRQMRLLYEEYGGRENKCIVCKFGPL